MRYSKLSKMYKKHFALLLCSQIFFSLTSLGFSGNLTQNLDWEAEVGDSQTYIYTKFYDISNENPNEYSSIIMNDKDEEKTVTIREGVTRKYEITSLDSDFALGVITFNGTVTGNETVISDYVGGAWDGVIRPTTTNKTYWEEWCRYRGLINVTGDLIIEEIVTQNFTNYHHYIYKWNWVTGWITYSYWKSWNATTIFVENEIMLIPPKPSSPDYFFFGVFLLGGFISLLFILNVYKKRK